jgi:uncharacterized protein (DUF2267 family)
VSTTAIEPRIHAWLHEVAENAGCSLEQAERFRMAVARRLEKGAQEYGDKDYRERPFLELLAEAAEETSDLPGWLSIALEGVAHDPEGRPEQIVHHVERILTEAAARAVEQRHLLELADELWKEYEPRG